jgi:hypothetical protein
MRYGEDSRIRTFFVLFLTFNQPGWDPFTTRQAYSVFCYPCQLTLTHTKPLPSSHSCVAKYESDAEPLCYQRRPNTSLERFFSHAESIRSRWRANAGMEHLVKDTEPVR